MAIPQNFARYLSSECGMPAHIPRRIGVDDRTMRVGAFPVGIETREFSRRARRAVRSSFVRKVRDSMPGAMMHRRGPAGLHQGHHAAGSRLTNAS